MGVECRGRVVAALAHLIPVLMQYGKKGFEEKENVSSCREQKKLQKTGNSGWLVCAAVLDCSHLLLIVAIGIAHAMLTTQYKTRPTMLYNRLV